jgi:hypothetical protein
VPVAHACNPSYSGGRDQEDRGGSKPAAANSLRDPISKNPITIKRVGGVAQGVDLEFKPQYGKEEKKRKSVLLVGVVGRTVAFHFEEKEWGLS